MQQPMRSYPDPSAAAPGPSAGSTYRYGYNGKEMDNEWYGDAGTGLSGVGNSYDYGFRIYNPRYARFLSVDPLTASYPMLTPYQFASNTPIQAIDLDGLEAIHFYWIKYDADGKAYLKKKVEKPGRGIDYADGHGMLLRKDAHLLVVDGVEIPLIGPGQASALVTRINEADPSPVAIFIVNMIPGSEIFDLLDPNTTGWEKAEAGFWLAIGLILGGKAAKVAKIGTKIERNLGKHLTKWILESTEGDVWFGTVEKAWREWGPKRGQLFEAILESTKRYKGFTHVGIRNNGFFRAVDFIKGNLAVSLKSFKRKDGASVSDLVKHVEDLAEFKAAGKNIDGNIIDEVRLDILIPEEGADKFRKMLQPVLDEGKQRGIKVDIFTEVE